MNIPFVDLKSQYQEIKAQVTAGINNVFNTTSFILGQDVADFEQEFAKYCDSQYCVGVGSGLDALKLALKAYDIQAGDEVILPVNTYIATALAVSDIGARPVLVDMDEKNFNIDISRIAEAVTEKTKAVIPVHLYGQTADMDQINSLARKHGLIVIEDACQAHGSKYKGKKAGSLSDTGCFSFYPGKNLGAYGDGGALTTNNEQVYQKLCLLRNYGQEKKYYHKVKGLNSRLDTIQAAVLKIKLKNLDHYNQKRYANAMYYNELLMKQQNIITPVIEGYSSHIFHLYVLRVPQRDQLFKYLMENNIGVNIHYPVPIHLQEAYQDLGLKKGAFPAAEKAADEIISLPMFPELTKNQMEYIVEKISKFYKGN